MINNNIKDKSIIKIIAGRFKGKKFNYRSNSELRPTKSIVREAVFNILGDIKGLTIADMFCGCGSLGIEAISRGAAFVSFFDVNQEHLNLTKSNLKNIGIIDNYRLIKNDSTNLIFSEIKYDVVLIDPPYNNNLANLCIESLIKNGYLSVNASLVVELGLKEDINEFPNIIKKSERIFGNSKIIILTFGVIK